MCNGYTESDEKVKARLERRAMAHQEALAERYAREAYVPMTDLETKKLSLIIEMFKGVSHKMNVEKVCPDPAHIRTSAEDFGTRSIISGGEVLEIDDPHYYDSDYASWDGDPF